MTGRIFLSPPHMSGRELDLVQQAFESNFVAPAGPMLKAFEEAFCAETGFAHAVALSSGTAALHLALRYLDVQPGDTVYAASLTFIGSVAAVSYERAEPVFFDCDPQTWTLDPELLAEALETDAARGRLPKAVIPTDLYGQSCDLDRLVAICDRYEVPVLADAAEGMGTRYKDRHAGKGAWAAAASFNGNKIITSSGGGMLASDDAALIERARYLSQAARQPVPHYEHTEVGYNYRMSNIVAAIGLGQLESLKDRVDRRRAIFNRYTEHLGNLPGITFMPEADYGRHTRWLTVMLVDEAAFGVGPEAIRLALEAENIEARPVWKPMHMQPVFEQARMVGGAVCEDFFARGLCLPSGSQLRDEDVARICAMISGLRR